jgi:hypothetical protein
MWDFLAFLWSAGAALGVIHVGRGGLAVALPATLGPVARGTGGARLAGQAVTTADPVMAFFV